MTATCTITFTDGTTKQIDLGKQCIEINTSPERLQSISVNQTRTGFNLVITKPLMEGKRFQSITIEKQP